MSNNETLLVASQFDNLAELSPITYLFECANSGKEGSLLEFWNGLINSAVVSKPTMKVNSVAIHLVDNTVKTTFLPTPTFRGYPGYKGFVKDSIVILENSEFHVLTPTGRIASEKKQAVLQDYLDSLMALLQSLSRMKIDDEVEKQLNTKLNDFYIREISHFKKQLDAEEESIAEVTVANTSPKVTLPSVRSKNKMEGEQKPSENKETDMKVEEKEVAVELKVSHENATVVKAEEDVVEVKEEKTIPEIKSASEVITSKEVSAVDKSVTTSLNSMVNTFLDAAMQNLDIMQRRLPKKSLSETALEKIEKAKLEISELTRRSSNGLITCEEILDGTLFKTIRRNLTLIIDEIGATADKAVKEALSDLIDQFNAFTGHALNMLKAIIDDEIDIDKSCSIIERTFSAIWGVVKFIGRLIKTVFLKIIDFLFNWDFDDIEKRGEKPAKEI
ncbi:hypothetical protein [Proteus mirabilis]|uniref:hypothetical protein n=1 Tax=Proteus mirabilis TaxID=584 RepID=UPI0034D4FE1E